MLTDGAKYRPGRVVVASAGNERTDPIHVRRTLPANSTQPALATVDIAANTIMDWVHIWVRNPTDTCPVAFPLDLFVRRVGTVPNADVTSSVRIGHTSNPAGVFPSWRTRIVVQSNASNIINGDHEYRVGFVTTDNPNLPTARPMQPTRWAIGMTSKDSHALDVHMWIMGIDGAATSFVGANGPDDAAYLVGAPAASAAAIAVGSSNSLVSYTSIDGPQPRPPIRPLGELSFFSSPGPLRDSSIRRDRFYHPPPTHEINGVDCCAPGSWIQSARSKQATYRNAVQLKDNTIAVMNQGTSMASPVVTGLVANVLAEEPTLTLPQVLDRLKKASFIPPGSTLQPPPGTPGPKPLSRDWGYGLVDAGKLKP